MLDLAERLFPGHRFNLMGKDDDPLLVTARAATHDHAIGSERLPPEGRRL